MTRHPLQGRVRVAACNNSRQGKNRFRAGASAARRLFHEQLDARIALDGSDILGPLVTGLSIHPYSAKLPPTISATIDDSGARGGSRVAGAEYFIGQPGPAGTGLAMQPADGAFDSQREAVIATIPAEVFAGLGNGYHTIHVHGLDAAGNWDGFAASNFYKGLTEVGVLKQSVRSVTIPPADGNPNDWTFSLSKQAPKWATVDAKSGVLTLHPDLDATDAAFEVILTHKNGASARHAIEATVFASGIRDGHLFVFGTSGNDRVELVRAQGLTTLVFSGVTRPILLDDGTAVQGIAGLAPGKFVIVDAGNGANEFYADDGQHPPLLYFGGNGKDTVHGTSRGDILAGGNGSDILFGRGGDDVVLGGRGSDTTSGGAGDDYLHGGLITPGALHSLAIQKSWPADILELLLTRSDVVAAGDTGEEDFLVESGNGVFRLTDSSLEGIGTDVLVSLESVTLRGGPDKNTFDVSGWTGSGILVGGGAEDSVVASKDVNFWLNDEQLSTSDGMTLQLVGVTTARLQGGASRTRFDISHWSGHTLIDAGSKSVEFARGAPAESPHDSILLGNDLASLYVSGGAMLLAGELRTAPGGRVELNSSGAVQDGNPDMDGSAAGNNIFTSHLVISARGGIGHDNPLDTTASVITLSNTLNGDVRIINNQFQPAAVQLHGVQNPVGLLAFENFGISNPGPDQTEQGITISAPILVKGKITLVSHSPLNILYPLTSLDGGDVELDAGTLSLSPGATIDTTGEVNLNTASANLSHANLGQSKLSFHTDAAIINLSQANFGSLTSLGNSISIDLDGANFSSLLNLGSNSTIDLEGANFTSLLNLGSQATIDLGGAVFNTLLNGVSSIDLDGANFSTLVATTAGSGSQIDLAGAQFGSLVNTGGSVEIDLNGAQFSTLLNAGGSAQIDLEGANFTSLLNLGSQATIDLGGAVFNTLLNGVSSIDLDGANFSTLVATTAGSGTQIDLSGAQFGSLVNTGGSVEIDLNGARFSTLLNAGGSAQIDLNGAQFSTLLNAGGSAQIDLEGANFGSLLNLGSQATIDLGGAVFNTLLNGVSSIDLDGANFSTLVATTAGSNTQIDLSGAQFNVLVNTGGSVQIDLNGAQFNTLLNAGGSAQIDLNGAQFNTLLNAGNSAQIDLEGANFTSLLNLGSQATIDLGGAVFNTLLNGVSSIDLDGANFSTLVATTAGSGTQIDLSGAQFNVLVNTGGSVQIDLNGAQFSTLLNAGGSAQIDLEGASFTSLLNLGSQATIDLGGAVFSTLLNQGTDTRIDLDGATFSTLLNSGSGVLVIDLNGAEFQHLMSSGSGVTIDLRHSQFVTLVNSGEASLLQLRQVEFWTLDNHGSDTRILIGDSRFSGLTNTGSGAAMDIYISGSSFTWLENSGDRLGRLHVVGSSFEFVRNDGDDVVSILLVGGAESNTFVNNGNRVTALFWAGGGDDVFVNNGRYGGAYGNDALLLDIRLGDGDDRMLVGGLGVRATLHGGAGSDTYLFVGEVTGEIVIGEPSGQGGRNTLDFSNLTTGGIVLDAQVTTRQNVAPGLAIVLSDALGIHDVVGTRFADTIRGNANDNILMGADLPDERHGAPLPWNGRTQWVYLDFDSETEAGEYVYPVEVRQAILDRLQDRYSGFHVQFVLDWGAMPPPPEFATVYFNQSRDDGTPGGDASEIDFGNRNLGGYATVQVNGLIGIPGGPAGTDEDWIAASTWMAAHELAHLLGLRHSDSFGPIGYGIHAPPGSDGFYINPVYAGFTAAFETNYHLVATPAMTGFTLQDLVSETFFSEREAVKLAIANVMPAEPDGKVLVREQATSHAGLTPAASQPVALQSIAVPNRLIRGLNAGKLFQTAAVVVEGEITLSGEKDVYRFEGRRGDLMNLQLMSTALDRYRATGQAFDAELRLFDATGRLLVVSDDEFESQDPNIIDLVLPADGWYYVQVSGYDAEAMGKYELLIYRFNTASPTDGGDILEGRAGNDMLAGGMGDDVYVFSGGNLGSDVVLEDLGWRHSGNAPRDRGDALDFRKFSGPVRLDLASTAVQVVRSSHLSLRLATSWNLSSEPGEALGVEHVWGSAFNDTLSGNSRDNTFRVHTKTSGRDSITGRGGSDTLDFSDRTSGVTVDLGIVGSSQRIAGEYYMVLPGLDIENVVGTQYADMLVGNSLDNLLVGLGGNDELSGGAGDDILLGGAGNDLLTGGSDHDLLIGGLGADILNGSSGNDILVAGRLMEFRDRISRDEELWMRAFLNRWANYQEALPKSSFSREAVVDAAIDKLLGASGSDWFILDGSDELNEAPASDDFDLIYRI
jgi:Ca2+-binding RTX toxin-like protein